MDAILGKRVQCSNVFIGTAFSKRTDSDFRSKTYPLHHNCNTPLSNLPIDMVKAFNVDYMHCTLLVVMKKLLHIYMSKDKAINTRHKLSKSNIIDINTCLKIVECCIPNTCCRK